MQEISWSVAPWWPQNKLLRIIKFNLWLGCSKVNFHISQVVFPRIDLNNIAEIQTFPHEQEGGFQASKHLQKKRQKSFLRIQTSDLID